MAECSCLGKKKGIDGAADEIGRPDQRPPGAYVEDPHEPLLKLKSIFHYFGVHACERYMLNVPVPQPEVNIYEFELWFQCLNPDHYVEKLFVVICSDSGCAMRLLK